MIEDIIANAANVMALLALPAYFLLFWAKDMVQLKFAAAKGKKKGAKFVVGISTDKTIRFNIERPIDKSHFLFKNEKGHEQEVAISPDRLYFAPQLGIQAAIVTQGSKTLYDPYAENKVDPIDGEYINVAIQKARLLGAWGAGWGATKEQKLLLIVLIAVLAVAGLQFAGMSQFNEIATAVAANHRSVMALIEKIPMAL